MCIYILIVVGYVIPPPPLHFKSMIILTSLYKRAAYEHYTSVHKCNVYTYTSSQTQTILVIIHFATKFRVEFSEDLTFQAIFRDLSGNFLGISQDFFDNFMSLR